VALGQPMEGIESPSPPAVRGGSPADAPHRVTRVSAGSLLPRDDREDVPFLETWFTPTFCPGKTADFPHTFAYRNFFGCPVDGPRPRPRSTPRGR